MRSLGAAGSTAGFTAHRFRMRTCGGTERFCETLYHAGLTSDLLAAARRLDRPVYLVGFSLRGNVVLKLAGELGETDLMPGVCAVSPPSIWQPAPGVSQSRTTDCTRRASSGGCAHVSARRGVTPAATWRACAPSSPSTTASRRPRSAATKRR